MELKKGNRIYRNMSLTADDYSIYSINELQKQLRERNLTSNGQHGEQTTTERLIFEELKDNYSPYYLVEYTGDYPVQLVEISTIKATR